MVLGKPSAHLGAFLQARYGFDKGRTCIVGDRLDSDILLGHNCGLESVLVMTGTTDASQLGALRAADPMRPDFVLDCFGQLALAGTDGVEPENCNSNHA